MKIYEVFVCVPYLDPDWNECYEKHNGTLFAYKSDAEVYMDKMVNDEKANYDMEPELDHEEPKRRYITLSDYTETEIDWETFCYHRNRQTMSEEKIEHLSEIFKTNHLVHDMKQRDAILLAVTYGGNKWYLREVELHFEMPKGDNGNV